MENSGNLTALETEVITLMSEMLRDQSGPNTAYLESKKNRSVVQNKEVRVTREVLVIHNTIACGIINIYSNLIVTCTFSH